MSTVEQEEKWECAMCETKMNYCVLACCSVLGCTKLYTRISIDIEEDSGGSLNLLFRFPKKGKCIKVYESLLNFKEVFPDSRDNSSSTAVNESFVKLGNILKWKINILWGHADWFFCFVFFLEITISFIWELILFTSTALFFF